MTTNEIKKALLKENPLAKLDYITGGAAYYSTNISGTNDDICFKIPMEETVGGYFYSQMAAKMLMRWIHIDQLQLELGE